MYPHSYQVLKILKKYYHLTYYGKDDRGSLGNLIARGQISWFHAWTWKRFLLNLYWIFRSSGRIDHGLKILLKEREYDFVIVIDQSAYWRVVRISRSYKKHDFKLILWSHDYFCPGHPLFSLLWVQRIIRHNRRMIHKCASIIIQDPARSVALDSQIQAEKIPRIYLPASLLPEKRAKVIALKNTQKVFSKKNKVTLMQLGCIGEERCSDLFLEEYQNLPEHIQLLYHGFIQNDMQPMLRASHRKPMIRKAHSNIKAMWESLSMTNIALIAFRDRNLNTFFVSKASGQLAQFMACGIPVICFNSPEMGAFLENNQCGFYLKHLSVLKKAISQITLRYAAYSRSAYQAYLNFFDLSKYEDSLIRGIEES